jgi:hypothetical protein
MNALRLYVLCVARESSIYQTRFSTDKLDFENFNEIAATSVDERKLPR